MEEPCVDSWAALHLPAIEQLLYPEDDLKDGKPPGIGDTGAAFFHPMNVSPFSPSYPGYAPSEEGYAPSEEDQALCMELQRLQDLYSNLSQWTPVAPNEVGTASPAPKKPGKAGTSEGRSGPIGHKKVPKKINIQEEFGTDGCEITTAMIRNVPNQLNRKQFVERLDQLGFQGMYDFVYVPIDRATRMNVGYAFVNFINSGCFRLCQNLLQGKKFLDHEDGDKRRSGKPIIVSAAHVQGLENNEKHFKDAAVAHTLHRPVKFSAERRRRNASGNASSLPQSLQGHLTSSIEL